MSTFKTNHDLLEAQQEEFAKGGTLVRNIFSISAKHPLFSLSFVLSFGLLTSALYDLVSSLAVEADTDVRKLIQRLALTTLFVLIPCWIYIRVKSMHKDLFVPTPLNQKKVLVTLLSKGRTNFKELPSYNVYESLLYTPNGSAAVNSIHKVIFVTTETAELSEATLAFKSYIEASGREVETYSIVINDKSLLDIQRQIEQLFIKLKGNYKPHEIIADYTGGNKDMSIALLRVSEKEVVVPIYLNEATTGNYSQFK
jgi:hypothetical protein